MQHTRLLPSRLLRLRRRDFSDRTLLDFDLAVMEFGESFERERDATEMRTIPKRRGPAKAPHPKYTPEQLAEKFLGVDVSIISEIADARMSTIDDLADDILSGDADDWLYDPGGEA
jgi:hypothetical protein